MPHSFLLIPANRFTPSKMIFQSRKLDIIIHGRDTLGAMSIVQQAFSIGTGSVEHRHTKEDHSAEIMSGSFEFSIDDEKVKVSTGDILFIGRLTWHSFTATSNGSVMRITITPAGLEEVLQLLEYGQQSTEKAVELAQSFGVEFR